MVLHPKQSPRYFYHDFTAAAFAISKLKYNHGFRNTWLRLPVQNRRCLFPLAVISRTSKSMRKWGPCTMVTLQPILSQIEKKRAASYGVRVMVGKLLRQLLLSRVFEHSPCLQVLLSVCSLLTDANPSDPLVGSIATQYLQNRSEHDRIARMWTKRFATGLQTAS